MAKSTRKKTLRDYTRSRPTKEDELRFRNAMNERSPMVVAVIMAIELEYLLERLIVSRLKRRDDQTVDILCKDNGALATFFSKIGLSYALGIIDEIQMEHLNTVRRIRNAFAHSRREISFATEEVRRELAATPLPKKKRSYAYEAISIARKIAAVELPPGAPEDDKDLGPRAGYVLVCLTTSRALRSRMQAIAVGRARYMKRPLGSPETAFNEPNGSSNDAQDAS